LQDSDVVIVGAGAAGLICAITAAKRGRRVVVLEKSNKPGKKILMSGGGRCNFTNYYIDPEHYLSENSHFCKSALSSFTQYDFIQMVESRHIGYHEKTRPGTEPGQLFCNDSAKQILKMLLDECDESGTEILLNCNIESVNSCSIDKNSEAGKSSCYQISTDSGQWRCQSLVVASGGLSIPTLGGSDIGYRIARQFGLPVIPLSAGLVPFIITGKLKNHLQSLSGLSLPVSVSCQKHSFKGNMLFTHRGLSGPAILQISNYWSEGDELAIDLLPDSECESLLIQAKSDHPKMLLRNTLSQLLPTRLVTTLETLFWPELKDQQLISLPDNTIKEISASLHHWRIKPAGTEGYRTAEVTRGGVDTRELSSKTMECTRHKGLYFIGEVVDVTGHLGGFNFQWAWSSGVAAGKVV
jgi:predicted Rossmann fold flavoprotein